MRTEKKVWRRYSGDGIYLVPFVITGTWIVFALTEEDLLRDFELGLKDWKKVYDSGITRLLLGGYPRSESKSLETAYHEAAFAFIDGKESEADEEGDQQGHQSSPQTSETSA